MVTALVLYQDSRCPESPDVLLPGQCLAFIRPLDLSSTVNLEQRKLRFTVICDMQHCLASAFPPSTECSHDTDIV